MNFEQRYDEAEFCGGFALIAILFMNEPNVAENSNQMTIQIRNELHIVPTVISINIE